MTGTPDDCAMAPHHHLMEFCNHCSYTYTDPSKTETPEIPEEAIEDVAKAIYEAPHDGLSRNGYDAAPRDIKDLYRAEARLAAAALLPHLQPSEAETKALAETTFELGRALGRKEAAEEIAAAIEGEPSERRCAQIARNIASQPSQAVSNGLTAPSGHTDHL